MTLSRAVDLTQRLLRCQSVTPNDGGALPLLADMLRDAGFTVDLVSFSGPGEAEILNLYARIGTVSPCLVFAGHTDVVPPGNPAAWRFDPFSGEIADGMIWGRGACDMKGGVAASIAAALDHLEGAGAPNGSIAFLITGDEEGPAINGTVKLLDWVMARGERFDACVLGEPTNPNALGDMMKIGRRGSLTGEIVVHGRLGHVAYPHLASNPIPPLLRILVALTDAPLDKGTSSFDASNLEVVTVDTGNPSTNVIPAEARARFNIRFNDLWTPETLRAEVQTRVDTASAGADVSLDFMPCNALAFLTGPGRFTTLVADAVEAETGLRPVLSTTGGTSDARFISAHCPVVEFGLVGRTMHAIDERVAIADIDRLTAVYGRIITSFLT
ncbi:succinyl-diaminopimelate desuccinylase [Lichenihabitans sp. PAMC28606]|uniref:succinyl-diaminopimelate desuccinylase n=1 Tax=Lichenihabitans sp. PAMC28606 TaxID=2880932 RepID=UPI001D0BD418|nr:succinyl-diaminopimelate desuccinylase [Lichenihabitans sp. PAMC28606]UDL94509.1 succinyl-diaminopimelate desuccinylase [Lichenihabitans sp. PAMC28606]